MEINEQGDVSEHEDDCYSYECGVPTQIPKPYLKFIYCPYCNTPLRTEQPR